MHECKHMDQVKIYLMQGVLKGLDYFILIFHFGASPFTNKSISKIHWGDVDMEEELFSYSLTYKEVRSRAGLSLPY